MIKTNHRLASLGDVLSMEEAERKLEYHKKYANNSSAYNTKKANELMNRISLALESIEELSSDEASIRRIHNRIKFSVECGKGINPKTANVVKATLNNISKRNGISTNMVALESFDSNNSRLEASKALLVSLEEEEGMWEKIKKFLISLWEKIKGWWNKFINFLLGKNENTEERLRETLKKSEELDPETDIFVGRTASMNLLEKASKNLNLEFDPRTFNPKWIEKNFMTRLVGKIKPIASMVNKWKGIKNNANEQMKYIDELKGVVAKEKLSAAKERLSGGSAHSIALTDYDSQVRKVRDLREELTSLISISSKLNVNKDDIREVERIISEMEGIVSATDRNNASMSANKELSSYLAPNIKNAGEILRNISSYLDEREKEISTSLTEALNNRNEIDKEIEKIKEKIGENKDGKFDKENYIKATNELLREKEKAVRDAENEVRKTKAGTAEYDAAIAKRTTARNSLKDVEEKVKGYEKELSDLRESENDNNSKLRDYQAKRNLADRKYNNIKAQQKAINNSKPIFSKKSDDKANTPNSFLPKDYYANKAKD